MDSIAWLTRALQPAEGITGLEVAIVFLLAVLLPAYLGYRGQVRARRKVERRMAQLAESLPGAVFQFRRFPDGTGRYEYLSRNAAAVRGIDREAALLDPEVVLGTVIEHDRERLLAALDIAGRELRPFEHDFRVLRGHAGVRWIRVSSAPRRDPDGSVLWSGHWDDVTESRRMMEELRAAKEAADASNRAKSTFLATMSHEIRTPMHGVLGMLELLALTPHDAEQRATLSVVRESGRSLLRIIDDILEFSRVEAGRLELRPEPGFIGPIIDRVWSVYSSNASSKGLTLRRSVDPRLDRALLIDALRLQQILNNFVSNAIKFTAAGEVAIHAELVESRDEDVVVRFTVTDTGIGIERARLDRLFQPFVQASDDIAVRFGGSGLGLSICRGLAGLMGGTVEARSEEGRGTEMVATLPLPIARQAPAMTGARPVDCVVARTPRAPPSASTAQSEGRLVLLADDHPVNRLVLLKQLNALGYAAETAADGLEALELWSSERFALVITDCNMPEMDGYQLARHIRACESSNGQRRTTLIACTANSLDGQAERCLAEGMDDCIAKPVDLEQLASRLSRWLPLPEVPGDPGEPARDSPAIDFDVLREIAGGDDGMTLEILERFLGHHRVDLALLDDGLAVNDLARVALAAHRMRGASGTVGARPLARACQAIESACRARDAVALRTAIAAFREASRGLDEAIEQRLAAGAGMTIAP